MGTKSGCVREIGTPIEPRTDDAESFVSKQKYEWEINWPENNTSERRVGIQDIHTKVLSVFSFIHVINRPTLFLRANSCRSPVVSLVSRDAARVQDRIHAVEPIVACDDRLGNSQCGSQSPASDIAAHRRV